jgi:tetratricopeptide (TPR) repeat protein
LTISRQIKYQEAEGECELGLGQAAFLSEDLAAAEKHFNRALSICRDAQDKKDEAIATYWLGRLDLARGELVRADQRLREALRAFRAFEMRDDLLGCLEDLVALRLLHGTDPDSAVRIAAAATALRSSLGLMQAKHVAAAWDSTVSALRATTDQPNFETQWRTGTDWDSEQVVKEALS